jgi:hypothetical protein
MGGERIGSVSETNQTILQQIPSVKSPPPVAGPAGPILDLKQTQVCKPENPASQKVVLRKCSCGSPWCPSCFKRRSAPKVGDRLALLNWESTRQVVLSIDRKKFKDGREAFYYLREKKALSQLIHNLKRTVGITVTDWVWVLEWHSDGFPHWHLFIDVNITGKGGMIGGDVIRQYWTYGAATESFIRSENHWKVFTNYFGKHGYFQKKKAHQAALPDWAREETQKIRKFGSQSGPKKERNEFQKKESKLKEIKSKLKKEEEKQMPEMKKIEKTYDIILEECGQATMCVCYCQSTMEEFGYRIPVPFADMMRVFKDKGEFQPKVGFVLNLSEKEFDIFWAKYGFLVEIKSKRGFN